MRKSNLLTYTLLSLSVIFWGVSFIFTKELFLTEPNLTVTTLIFLRLGLASAVMVPSLLVLRRLRRDASLLPPLRKGDLKWFLLLTLCEPFLYHLCETSGVQLVSGSLASVVIATIPLFVPFGMWVAYREAIRPTLLLGVLLSLVGVALTLLGGQGLTGNLRGILLLSGAVVIAVVYTLLLVKVVHHYNPLVITTYQNLIGLAFFLPLLLLQAWLTPAGEPGAGLLALGWSAKTLLLLLTLGICCSTLAYAFYNYGVRRLGASRACIFNNAIPIFSLIAAILLQQETFAWSKVAGIVLVISGLLLAQRTPKES